MLAKAVSNQFEVLKWISKQSKSAIIEYKYDGERIQIHYKRGSYLELYSRSFESAIVKFRAIVDPLKNILDKIEGFDSCILDGEIIAYDFEK